jgi:fructose-1-phosphate kinase PfkB-like protein
MSFAPPRLLTLTGNLLAEHTGEFADWQPGHTARARGLSFQVGGKGLNVAKLFQRLGGTVTALAFVGGHTGAACRAWLDAHAAYAGHLIPTTTPTRPGWVVRAPNQPETTFLGPDQAPDAAALLAAADYLDALPADVTVALCGSFPGWADPGAAPLRQALHRLADKDRLVADTYGPPLVELSRWPLPLIKINRGEFEALTGANGRAADDEAWATDLDQTARDHPVETWIVTDGPRPVLLWQRDRPIQRLTTPPIPVVSPTGSGDVLFAALLYYRWHEGLDWPEALRRALPLAAANTASAGIADFPLETARPAAGQ